jgi:hypothetical protein
MNWGIKMKNWKCKLFGHKYKTKKVNLRNKVKEAGLRFDSDKYERASKILKDSNIDPENVYVCKRCGETINESAKFVAFYTFL